LIAFCISDPQNCFSIRSQEMDELDDDADVCRVCRFKGTPSKPLYNPCVCSGSIKYTHNDCLIRWLNQTKRDMCELCNHHIAFSTIYAHGMPSRLPFNEVLSFICMVIMKRVVFDVRCYLVIAMWLYVVPLIEWRLHQCMFNGTFEPVRDLFIRIDWSSDFILLIICCFSNVSADLVACRSMVAPLYFRRFNGRLAYSRPFMYIFCWIVAGKSRGDVFLRSGRNAS